MRHKSLDLVLITVREVLMGVLVVMCVVRAGVEVRRMVTESPKSYYSEITACSEKPNNQEGIIWEYRNLEAQCER